MIARALRLIERASLKSAKVTYTVATVLALLSGLALYRARIVTDVTEIVRTPSARTFKTCAEVFGLNQRAFLLVEADKLGREAHLLRFAKALEAKLASAPLVLSVEHGLSLDPQELATKLLPFAPLYFDAAELDRLLTKQGMKEQLEKQAARMRLAGLGIADEWAARDPLELGRALAARAQTLQGIGRFAPGSTDFLSEDGRALLVIVTGRAEASTMAGGREIVHAIDDATRSVLGESWAQGLTVSATGGFHFQEESERIIKGDLIESMSTATILCALIVAIGLRIWSPRAVTLLCVPVLWGTFVGMGVFAALARSFSALSLACAAVLVGLGSDYTIHVSCAALELRAKGAETAHAITEGIRQTWTGLLGSVFTSIAAFLAYQASDQTFLKEMGLLTSIGLFVCLLGAVLLLPPILRGILEREGQRRTGEEPRTLGVSVTSSLGIRHPRIVVLLSLGLSALCMGVLVISPIELENDLRNVQARGSRPLAAQERIAKVMGSSQEPVTILLEGDSEAEVVSAAQRLEAPLELLLSQGTLVSRASVAALLPDPRRENACLEVLAAKNANAIEHDLVAALDEAGFDPQAFEGAVRTVVAALSRREPLRLDELRSLGMGSMIDRFVQTRAGKSYALVLVNPKADLWSSSARSQVSAQLKTALSSGNVRGEITSLFLISDESANQVALDFKRITGLTVLAVSLIVVIQFRSPLRILLVLLPPSLGLLWTAGIFALAHGKLNLMNLGVLPMLFGVGIDDGIYPIDRYFSHREAGVAEAFRWKGGAMVVCMTTTMVSFGSLALSQSLGIASVGVLTFVGLGLCLVASIVTLPAVLELLRSRREGS